jgi:hypothetical protein
MTDHGPYVVLAQMPDGRQWPVPSQDGRALLVLDSRRLAEQLADGILSAGVGQATISTVEGSDDALAEFLDSHDAPPPVTFETLVGGPLDGASAWVYGLRIGERMLRELRAHQPELRRDRLRPGAGLTSRSWMSSRPLMRSPSSKPSCSVSARC